METAKLFSNGGSQAVRLPKNCRIQGTDEVLVNHIGNIVIIMPKDDPWSGMMSALDMFTSDFMREPPEDFPVEDISL